MNKAEKVGEDEIPVINLAINNAPIEIDTQTKAKGETYDADMIITLQNSTGFGNAIASYKAGGGKSVDIDLKPGVIAPELVIKNFAANKLFVSNASIDTKVKINAGLYGREKATIILEEWIPRPLNQFVSASASTKSREMMLQITNATEFSIIFVFATGKPKAYALCADNPEKLPAGYTATSNEYITIKENWMGNPLFILNASPSKTSAVTVRLVAT